MDEQRRPPPAATTCFDEEGGPRSDAAGCELIAGVRSLGDLPLVLTIAEVAAVLRCDRRTVYALIRARAFPATKLGSRWVIERDGVIAWLRADRLRSKRS